MLEPTFLGTGSSEDGFTLPQWLYRLNFNRTKRMELIFKWVGINVSIKCFVDVKGKVDGKVGVNPS